MDNNLKIVVGTQQEWQAGTLPPQVDSITTPGSVQLYRPNLSFTRASIAYLPDGTQVAANAPRYVTGKFGKAIMIEEGATNLMGPNGFLDTAGATAGLANGWNTYGTATGTRSLDTTLTAFGRAASQKLTRTGGGAATDRWGIFYGGITGGITTPHTISVLLNITQLDAGAVVRVYCDYTDSATTAITETISKDMTATTNGWTTVSLSPTTKAATARCTLYIWIDGGAGSVGANGTVYVQVVQPENKPAATSFTTGTRAVETCTIPAAVVPLSEWSVEFQWKPLKPFVGVVSQQTSPKLLQVGDYYGSGSLTLWAFYAPSGAEPYLNLYVKGQTNTGWSSSWNIKPSGTGWYDLNKWTHVRVRGINGSTFYVDLDGVPYGPYTITDTITSWAGSPAYVWIGGEGANSESGGSFDDVRCSSIMRTGAVSGTTPITADSNTLALFSFDNSLVSSYPASAIIITKAIDLGSIHDGPIDINVIGTTPAGTTINVKRYQTSPDGINWSEWRDVDG